MKSEQLLPCIAIGTWQVSAQSDASMCLKMDYKLLTGKTEGNEASIETWKKI